jgi:hypothetical protein
LDLDPCSCILFNAVICFEVISTATFKWSIKPSQIKNLYVHGTYFVKLADYLGSIPLILSAWLLLVQKVCSDELFVLFCGFSEQTTKETTGDVKFTFGGSAGN